MIKKGLTTDNLVTDFSDKTYDKQLKYTLGKILGESYCEKCGKIKEEDDCNWRTVNGTPVCFKDGEDPKDSIDKAFADKGGSGGGKKDYTKKDIDTNAKKIWDGYTQKQKVNHYTSFAGRAKPGQSHFVNKIVGKMTFDALPKYARQSL